MLSSVYFIKLILSIEDLKIVAYREEITANFKKREDKFVLNTVPNKYDLDLDEILNFTMCDGC